MREDVKIAVETLQRWGVVALPTETVYGLAADATNEFAVRKIFELKGRPRRNPLIVHVKDLARAEEIGVFSPLSRRLASVFWPGPLTIVVPLREGAGLSPLVTAGHDTIALRAPAHPLMQMVLSLSGLALAAPSANRSGAVSPTEAAHVRGSGMAVDFILDGGAAERGLESTIVMVSDDEREIFLLRPGPVTVEAIEGATGLKVKHAAQDETAPVAPGALHKHYAPKARVRLGVTGALAPGAGLLAFGPEAQAHASGVVVYQLSERADPEEAARRLFAGLHWLDGQGVEEIAVRPLPSSGVGAALQDRLQRAAAQTAETTGSEPETAGGEQG